MIFDYTTGADYVKDYLSKNNSYDMSKETEEQRKYRIETVYATIKALKHFNNEKIDLAKKIRDEFNPDLSDKEVEGMFELNEEIKAGDMVEWRFEHEGWRGDVVIFHCKKKFGNKFICEASDGIVFIADEIRKFEPKKTQEELDKEWVKQALIDHVNNADSLDELLFKAIDYVRKTNKQ